MTLSVSDVSGLVELTVKAGYEVKLTDGLLRIIGLFDGLGGFWLDAAAYIGDRPVDFTLSRQLRIHLEQLSTRKNMVDDAPSTLLASMGLGSPAFGDIINVSIPHLEYKCIELGDVHELTVSIRDDAGRLIDNHDLPIHLTLEFAESKSLAV